VKLTRLIPERIIFRETGSAGAVAVAFEVELEFQPGAVCVGPDGLAEPSGGHSLDLAFEVADQVVGSLMWFARVAAALRVSLVVVVAIPNADRGEVVPADDERCAGGRDEHHLPDDAFIGRRARVPPLDVVPSLQPGDKLIRRLMQRKESFRIRHPLIGVIVGR
jgi:hypothetical protein